jgi:type II secretory pathway pseudopilin PulG
MMDKPPLTIVYSSLSARIHGFTLLEVLLAIGLSTVVLFILTTAIHQFLTRTESGHGEVETSQLARALLNQMADDLRGARGANFTTTNQKASASDLEEKNGDLSELGLIGTATEVRIGQAASWYWEPVPEAESNAANGVPADATQIAQTVHPPETIRYFLREGDTLSTVELAKMGIDTMAVDSIAGLCLERWASALSRSDSEDSLAISESTTGQTSHSQWVQLLAPEVIELEFSYADDTGEFLDQWDSTEQGALPKAVQIELVLRKVPLAMSRGTQQDRVGSSHSDNTKNPTQRNTETYRLVVHLPDVQSPRAPTSQSPGNSTNSSRTIDSSQSTDSSDNSDSGEDSSR